MGGDHRRAGQGSGHPSGTDALPQLRAQPLQVGGEHPVGAEQRLDRHRCTHICDVQQLAEVGQRQQQHAQHAVGAVDEGKALLLGQYHRTELRAAQRRRRRQQRAVGVEHLALTHQRQRDRGQRRQVARATERAVLGHHGGDPGVEQRGVGQGGGRPDTGAPGGQGGQAQQHEAAHHLRLHRDTAAGRVGPDQRGLQGGPAVGGDVGGRQRTESG